MTRCWWCGRAIRDDETAYLHISGKVKCGECRDYDRERNNP